MADVGRDRAQLVLVAALVLAATLIGLALIVNTVIFTENLATRQSVDTGDTVKYRQAARAHAEAALSTSNYMSNDTTYDARLGNFTTDTHKWGVASTRYQVTSGSMSNFSVQGWTKGTRVIQDDLRTFEPANREHVLLGLNPLGLLDNRRWLVANDSQIRDFRMHVNRDSLEESDQNLIADVLDLLLFGGNAVFWTEIESQEGTWQMAVYEDDDTGNVSVTVSRPDGGISSCTVAPDSDGMAWVNVSGGTLNGDGGPYECEALAFLDEIEGSYDVYYINGNSIEGTYQFIADKEEETFREDIENQNQGPLFSMIEELVESLLGWLSLEPDEIDDTDTYHESNSNDPYTTTAIYNASVDVVYRTDGLDYHTTVGVPLEEPESAPSTGQAPEINLNSVSVDTDIETDWSVTDDGFTGDVEVVTRLIGYSSGNSTVIDSASSSGSGSVNFTASGGYEAYRIAIVAVDDNGNRNCLQATDKSVDLTDVDDISDLGDLGKTSEYTEC